ncbi:MAG: tannase/feruloyl esterase family alpha/beta hydrolase [Coriobacteriaceae bacterium]|nr:tannase/feruloyl esterase family alpha/beta hydrolase [Coriobacteriaceae bacterium]
MASDKRNFRLEKVNAKQWVVMNDDATPLDCPEESLSVEHIQEFVSKFNDDQNTFEVVSAEFNDSHEWLPDPMPFLGLAKDDPDHAALFMQHGLPEYYEVIVNRATAHHVDKITVLIPRPYNGRLMGIPGAGIRSEQPLIPAEWLFMQIMNNYQGLLNGFATVHSDAGNFDPRTVDWYIDYETGKIDYELFEYYGHTSLHWRMQVGKAVIEAVTGKAPEYSYAIGTSGGGREVMNVMYHHPEDIDGAIAFAPVTDLVNNCDSIAWPSIVMAAKNDTLPLEKLEAFQEAVFAKYGGRKAWLEVLDPTFDARDCIGIQTEAGEITELDAEVMNMIWEGPRDTDGTPLFFGHRPGTTLWEWSMLGITNIPGVISLMDNGDGTYTNMGVPLGVESLRAWAARDINWDWQKCTIDEYIELFKRARESANTELDFLSPGVDLHGLVAAGGKLIISTSMDDSCIPVPALLDYYDRASEACDGKDELRKNVRMFFTANAHSFLLGGPGISHADGAIALMRWVEDGIAPEEIPTEEFDPETCQVVKTDIAKLY